MNFPLGIWIVRVDAEKIGRYLEENLPGQLCSLTTPEEQSNRETFAVEFRNYQQWVLVMASGIAVRYLQGLPASKQTDPGVVVLDEGCRFAISLLGGHEGGANQLAYRVANLTGAIPVITTATDALKPLVVGVGCRRGVSTAQLGAAIGAALNKLSRSVSEIREIATIDLKATEPGLLAWCERSGIPLRIITRRLIRERPWVTESSAWVKANVEVDGVCEPCALLASARGKLILPKTCAEGVAVAIVEEVPEF